MTDQIVIIKNDDGSIGILYPDPSMFDPQSLSRQLIPELENKTDIEVLNWVINKDVPKGKSYRIANKSEVPGFREFRNAWTDTGTAISHDINKAIEIKKEQLRELRAPLLDSLDTDYLKADESGDSAEKQTIAAQKQLLRDVTKVTFPTDIDTLKDFIPDVLKTEEVAVAAEEVKK